MVQVKESKTYHDNGQLWEHCFHANGKRHGEFKDYYDNGQLLCHYLYVNGKISRTNWFVDWVRDWWKKIN